MTDETCRLLPDETVKLARWCRDVLTRESSRFEAARTIVRRLGAHRTGDRVEVGFWAPELVEQGVPEADVFLEILHPVEPLDLRHGVQRITFERQRLPLRQVDEFLFAVVEGVALGERDRLGSFYWARYRDPDGLWWKIPDYLAYSVPFGAFAPAEFYDIRRLDRERADRAYFEALAGKDEGDGPFRIGPPTNILQIHVGTATAGGTIASLNRQFASIAAKISRGEALLAEEEPFVGYDAVQLLPVEPTIEFEGGPGFWRPLNDNLEADRVSVELSRPHQTNWGYDVVISASSAINPAILESGRPDELADLAVTLHTFPEKPIRLIFDVVFGHADNQAIPLLSRHFFAGPNMYGQDLNYRHPVVRAILLEMQRRKVNLGADGVRVDGAQDFKLWNPETQELRHDDVFLEEMSALVQEVAGKRYRPWMIFEDGRPWPEEDWELSSTYRAVIDQQPHCFQWGPLTFAHNTPFLYTFWISKEWRIREIVHNGANWITGCANHDTLRRGTQVDPELRINTRLGDTPLEILDKAYDNPAATLFTYGFLPGVPMDFINASMRASWGFIRNTDDRYGVKVVSEETISLNWQIDERHFEHSGNFRRLKALGFSTLDDLRRFMRVLRTAVVVTDYDLDAIVRLMRAVDPPLVGAEALSVSWLKSVARAWMDDMHDYCNVSYYIGDLSPSQTRFNLALRTFRRARPWLRRELGAGEVFDRRWPCQGTVSFYGLRRSPDGGERILFVANMEGQPVTVTPSELPIPDIAGGTWTVAVATPRLAFAYDGGPVTLNDSEGLLLVKRTD
ncbi:MAG: glucosylglycerol hydrolase [Geminicoccaceae bacterium]